ncbi:MAG TPA: prolipoprotein diacylglyceryl transferase [Burkholderiales bacterium]
MLIHSGFDPVALQLGPVAIRWYGLMYLAGFAAAFLLGRHRIAVRADAPWNLKEFDDALFYGILGVVLGGRLGYILFYKFSDYLQSPLKIFAVWEGGMSFHGGLLGVVVALLLFCRRYRKNPLAVGDFAAPLVPIGLGAGRIGNFINGELWGRPTDLSWAMVFPQVDAQPRHPSQLYEFALEGVALFVILWLYSAKPRPTGAVTGLFILAYGVFRFGVEFTREPDRFLGFLALGFTMGQWLSLPMIVVGAGMMVRAYRRAA